MAEKKPTERQQAEADYLKSGGRISEKKLAERYGKTTDTVRRWKKTDRWEEKLQERRRKKKKGGQPGNVNAVGHGAPEGNQNAMKHGIYAEVNLDNINAEEQRMIQEAESYGIADKLKLQYEKMLVKQSRLEAIIEELTAEEQNQKDVMYITSSSEMYSAKREEQEDGGEPPVCAENEQRQADGTRLVMKYVNKTTAFERRMKAEAELDKTQRAIVKILDSMRGHELELKRLALEEQKYKLAMIRATGAYEIEPDVEDWGDDLQSKEASEDFGSF